MRSAARMLVIAMFASTLLAVVPTAASAGVPTTPPTVVGSGIVGQLLTASPGTWTPTNSSRTFSYQWLRCIPACTPVTGVGTNPNYAVVSADAGYRLRVRVTANDGGVAYSAMTPRAALATAPALVTAPVLAGTAQVGLAVTMTSGAWNYRPRSFTYAWERCSSATTCAIIPGATLDGYMPTQADVGLALRGIVTAIGSGASTPVRTGFSSPVTAGTLGSDVLTPAAVTTTLRPGQSQAVPDTLTLAALPRRADIVLALDTTGSMGSALTAARTEAADLVTQVRSQIPGARFAVADFQDPDLGTCENPTSSCVFGGTAAGRADHAYQLGQPLTYDTAAVQSALASLTLGFGGDLPESYNRMFREATTSAELGYVEGARRFLVVLGDNRPHDSVQASVLPACANTSPSLADPGRDELAGTADDLRTANSLDALKATGSTLLMVHYNSAVPLACFQQMAARTGGTAASGDSGSLATLIAQQITTAATRINDVAMRVDPPALSSWVTFGAFSPAEGVGGFRLAPATLTIPSTVKVPPGTAPGVYELTVTAVADGADRATQTITVTVLPEIQISASSVSVGEGDGTATVTVSLSGASTDEVRVDLTTVGGDATGGGSDYASTSQTVVFAPGQTSATVHVPIVQDVVDEPDERFFVSLSNPVGAVVRPLTPTETAPTITILDDDDAPRLFVDDVSVGEAAGQLVFTIRRVGQTSREVHVEVTPSGGTASDGDDVTLPAPHFVTLPLDIFAPTGSTTVSVPVTDDALDEADETVLLTIAPFGGTATIGDGSATGTIVDDDDAPTASVSDVALAEDDDPARTVGVPVSLDAPSGLAVKLDYTLYPGPFADPTAALGTGTVSIPAGTTATTITVPVPGNLLDEPDRSYLVVLDGFANAGAGDSDALVTLADDDDAPTVTIAPATIDEGAGTATVLVGLSAASGRDITVTVATGDGAAVAPLDYTATTTTLTFPAGTTSLPLAVPVVDDVLDEDDVETFTVAATGASFAVAGDIATMGIADDDATPTLSITDVTILEPNAATANAVLDITLSAVSGRDVTVRVDAHDGSATTPGDYTDLGTTLTIPAGVAGTVVAIPIVGDVTPEATETLRVVLSNAVNAAIADGEGLVTVTDDDNRPPSCTGVASSAAELSPPNHRLVPVALAGATDPDGDAVTLVVTGVTSDEPTNGLGDGDTPVDAVLGAADSLVDLRAERAGGGDGRVYVVSYRADDGRGGSCTGSVAVAVRKGTKDAVDSGQAYDATN